MTPISQRYVPPPNYPPSNQSSHGDSPPPAYQSPNGDSPPPTYQSPNGDSPTPLDQSPHGDSPPPAYQSPHGDSPTPLDQWPHGDGSPPPDQSPHGDSPPPAYQSPHGDSPPPPYMVEAVNPFQYRSELLREFYPNKSPLPDQDEYGPPARLPSYPHDVQMRSYPTPTNRLRPDNYTQGYNYLRNYNVNSRSPYNYLQTYNTNGEEPARTDLAHRNCCVVFLKVIATPFTFLGGTLLWAIYGLFRGVFSGISDSIYLINESRCGMCTQLLLIPCLIYFAIAMVYQNMILGLITGGIFGGYVSCNSLWNGDSPYFTPQDYFHLPMLDSIYHRAMNDH